MCYKRADYSDTLIIVKYTPKSQPLKLHSCVLSEQTLTICNFTYHLASQCIQSRSPQPKPSVILATLESSSLSLVSAALENGRRLTSIDAFPVTDSYDPLVHSLDISLQRF